MFKLKALSVSIAGTLLVACGSNLLWKTIFETPSPKVVTAFTVDSASSSYIGGAQRVGGDSPWNQQYEGLLLKYDTAGNLQWQASIPDTSFVLDVEMLNADTLVVVTGIQGSNIGNNLIFGEIVTENKVSEAWLVSANNGEFITKIADFDQSEVGTGFVELQVVDSKLYVASNSTQGQGNLLQIFDSSGTLERQWQSSDGTITDIEIADANNLWMVTSSPTNKVIRLNDALQQQAALSEETLGWCEGISVRSDGEHNYVICDQNVTQISRVDNSGAVLFSTDLGFLIESDSLKKDSFLYSKSLTQIDTSGNLLIASTRSGVYAVESEIKLGQLDIFLPSILESDVTLAKISSESGQVLWSDDIDNALFIGGDNFTAYYYYPLALTLRDDKPLLTFRAAVGNYRGLEGNNFCLNADTDGWVPFNTCALDHFVEQYAKTIVYNAETGARTDEVKHSVAYTRFASVDTQGNMLIAGDEESGMIHLRDIFSLADKMFTEPAEISTKSDIIVQKQSLLKQN